MVDTVQQEIRRCKVRLTSSYTLTFSDVTYVNFRVHIIISTEHTHQEIYATKISNKGKSSVEGSQKVCCMLVLMLDTFCTFQNGRTLTREMYDSSFLWMVISNRNSQVKLKS